MATVNEARQAAIDRFVAMIETDYPTMVVIYDNDPTAKPDDGGSDWIEFNFISQNGQSGDLNSQMYRNRAFLSIIVSVPADTATSNSDLICNDVANVYRNKSDPNIRYYDVSQRTLGRSSDEDKYYQQEIFVVVQFDEYN